MSAKRVSGPYPLSCITCRQRRKKCDRTHPACYRCKTGGFTCLGYASRDTGPCDSVPEPTPHQQSVLSFRPNSAPRSGRSGVPGLISVPVASGSLPPEPSLNTDHLPLTPSTFTWTRHLPTPPSFVDLPLIDDLINPGSYTNWLLPDESGPLHVPHGSVDQVEDSPNDYNESNSNSSRPEVPTTQANRIQPDLTVYISPDTSAVAAEYITSQYELAYSLMSFELANSQDSFVKSCVLVAITVSKSACWSLFIGAKVYEAAMSDYRARFTRRYIQPLNTFEQQILFELRFLIDPRQAYTTLSLAVPLYLSISNCTSLYNTLVSPQIGLARFAIADVTMSFLTGFPQFVPWDTTFVPEMANAGWEEWIPACPVVFALVLGRVNAWRHQDPSVRDPDEWRKCEKEVLKWHPSGYRATTPCQSWRAVGRLAVQEALRHMVLIYLYMGICGAKSDDPRVQSSCKQISRLCQLVDANPNMSTHMYFPSIVAGVCAIDETHRSAIYRCLREGESCRSFLFGTAGFAATIDHLWHGVGRNGGQVAWDDYIESCRAVVRMKR